MKITTNALILLIVVFGAGLGSGWLIGKCAHSPVAANTSIAADSSNTRFKRTPVAAKANIVSTTLTLQRADEIRLNYTNDGLGPAKPKTECVVHDLKQLKDYIKKLDAVFAGADPGSDCQGCVPGVALYLGKSYPGNYLLERPGNYGYLLKDNYTAFLMPVFYQEDSSFLHFDYVENGNIITNDLRVKVPRLAKFYSPLDHYNEPGFISKNFVIKLNKFLDEDPIGFDLGHTNP